MYHPIDMEKTGERIKLLIKAFGYDVRYIQKYLQLSCPQSIYRWFKGKVLPSVEHLHALSRLLNVHMEDLLVLQEQFITYQSVLFVEKLREKRLQSYVIRFQKLI